jgi:branched-chain amino acid transport system permease protein
MGFVFSSIADNEDVTRILGINASAYKLIAFVIGTATAGVAGALYAHHFRFIGPDSFGFVESISVLAMVIVGGIGSVTGIIFSAALLSVMPLLFQFIDDYKLLLYSALLFAMMRFSPDGLAGLCVRTYRKLTGTRA